MKKILLQNSSVSNFKKGKKSTSLSFLIHNALAIVDRDSLWQATERPRHQGTVQKYKKKYIFTILLVFILSVTALAQDAFITTWVVGDNTYGDGDLTVTIPTTGRGYNYTVDWGDGTIENNQTGNAEHTYTNAGEKTIKIYGDFPRIYFDNAGDKDKITAVTHWGDIQWQSMVNAFWGCSKLDVTASDAPNLQNVTNLYGMFAVASMLLGNETFNNWDVGKVENMINMFWNASSFNADIGSWNVGNVENMANMFRGASSFQGVNIGTWGSKTSKVTNMSYMFEGASAFNADISGWDVGEVTNMESMFYGAANFNNGGQPMNWGVKTGKVTDMNWMFYGASSFNADISGWDVGEVTNMYAMFYGATNFNNGGQPMNWDAKTGKVTNMVGMFLYASSFDADISGWDVGEVTTMHQMFAGASSFNADISGWDVGEVTTMEEMFYGATNFNNGGQPMNWDAKTGKVTDMSWMFYEAENFDQDIGDWDVGEVTTMEAMFYGATNFNNGGEPMNWDAKTGKVTDMSWMFFGAEKFNADISGWDVGEVTNMGAMFYGATNFNNGGQPMNWDAKTGKVTNMGFMFNGASAFNADISGWDVGEVTNMESMFQLATNFNNGGQPMNWDAKTGKVTDMSWMFYEAENFDQDIGDWDVINVTNMGYMFTGVKLSVANYDALLIGWNSKVLQNNVPFSGGLSQYCLGESARSNMMNNDNWTITDAGKFGPTVDDIANQTVPNSYTLPTITGANLSGNQRYYTGSNGTGTVYDSGDSIGFGDFTSYPITLYIYDGVGLSCDSEEDFQLTITSVPPPCTLLSLPLAGETNVGLATDFQWNPVSGATGYRLTVGTTSMGNDILDDVDVGNVLDYDLPDDLPTNSSIHVHITPYNL
ncbi:MAG: BspA family leucine-rich repeat surface protein, partial [Flavobacteriaceae bacterium]